MVSVACMRIKAWVFSAWSELIPVMYALFVLLRPRRFVELGVHNGMSFFAACQIVERLGLATECVAIDSWEGDEHAGFHDTSVFEGFRAYLGASYPRQQYIQAYFSAARSCFEDGSIDLLHIDGLHTYEAVKDDFQTWLPCMSDVGVVIFHDINVFERGFGVWRLWEELKAKYPAFGFSHTHGLGIIFVGREPHVAADLLRALAGNRHYGTLAQAFFEAVGTLLIEHRGSLAETEALRHQLAAVQHHNTLFNSTSWRQKRQCACCSSRVRPADPGPTYGAVGPVDGDRAVAAPPPRAARTAPGSRHGPRARLKYEPNEHQRGLA